MKGRLYAVPLLFSVALATSAAADEYLCDDNTRLNATYVVPAKGLGSVEIAFAGTDEQIVLPQVMASDGVRYAGGVAEFWIRGSQATLRRGGEMTTCKR